MPLQEEVVLQASLAVTRVAKKRANETEWPWQSTTGLRQDHQANCLSCLSDGFPRSRFRPVPPLSLSRARECLHHGSRMLLIQKKPSFSSSSRR